MNQGFGKQWKNGNKIREAKMIKKLQECGLIEKKEKLQDFRTHEYVICSGVQPLIEKRLKEKCTNDWEKSVTQVVNDMLTDEFQAWFNAIPE